MGKKGEIDTSKRAGEFTSEQLEKIKNIVQDPQAFKIPRWCLNNQKEYKDGECKHVTATQVPGLLRDIKVRLKKIASNRGIRHDRKLRVRGQHTKTTGRGRNVPRTKTTK